MRIISGKFRGKRLNPPGNINARPTTDFAKEGLFNILKKYCDFQGMSFLDIFAGTGNISYELISRGASKGDMVDISSVSHKFRLSMIENLRQEELKSYRIDAFRFLRTCNKKYDLIFADPPYGKVAIEKIPELVFRKKLLSEDGILIIEHPEETSFAGTDNFLEDRKYGRVNFSFFKYRNNDEEE